MWSLAFCYLVVEVVEEVENAVEGSCWMDGEWFVEDGSSP
jgi:hypothetical protein